MLHLLGGAVVPMVGLGYGWWGGGIHHATFKSRQTWGEGSGLLSANEDGNGSLASSSGIQALLFSLSCDLKLGS